eukprot:TRINITY_DN16479_c0_g1_i1.p3 TRINITY_DN16479_c0_g1~~TRINITY_DN16479_c0_g1_i1.p3  ORF type:complete len:193 (-),score=35.93 TRINITY_DN16479_c0_g1_i1:14-592(-)
MGYQQQIQELQEKAQRKKKKSKNYKILFQDCDKQAQETKEAYKSEVQSLNSQINEWEQQFKQIEARQSDMQNLINQLKEDNRVKQTQIQQLMEKNEKLDQELDQTSGQLQAESNKNQEFSSDNQILEKKCEELRELSVSYTHLTLPTICSVQISVVAVSLKKKNIQQNRLSAISSIHTRVHTVSSVVCGKSC